MCSVQVGLGEGVLYKDFGAKKTHEGQDGGQVKGDPTKGCHLRG